jgi:hypothetical protein
MKQYEMQCDKAVKGDCKNKYCPFFHKHKKGACCEDLRCLCGNAKCIKVLKSDCKE